MKHLELLIPHHELLECHNPLLLICDHIQRAVPEFLIPIDCAFDADSKEFYTRQFANMRINLAKAGVAKLAWAHVPDDDTRIVLFFGCDE